MYFIRLSYTHINNYAKIEWPTIRAHISHKRPIHCAQLRRNRYIYVYMSVTIGMCVFVIVSTYIYVRLRQEWVPHSNGKQSENEKMNRRIAWNISFFDFSIRLSCGGLGEREREPSVSVSFDIFSFFNFSLPLQSGPFVIIIVVVVRLALSKYWMY